MYDIIIQWENIKTFFRKILRFYKFLSIYKQKPLVTNLIHFIQYRIYI